MDSTYTPEEQRLIDVWEGHLRCEFADRDAAATVATMSDDNYVNHVPVMTGGRGRDEMLAFYGSHFIPKMVEVPLVVVVQLRAGKVVCERIYWDQASVLVQLGLLDPSHLPVAGADTARKVLNPGLPSNDLIRRAAAPGGARSNVQSV